MERFLYLVRSFVNLAFLCAKRKKKLCLICACNIALGIACIWFILIGSLLILKIFFFIFLCINRPISNQSQQITYCWEEKKNIIFFFSFNIDENNIFFCIFTAKVTMMVCFVVHFISFHEFSDMLHIFVCFYFFFGYSNGLAVDIT